MFIKHVCMVSWDDCMFRSRSPHHISVGLFGFAHILITHICNFSLEVALIKGMCYIMHSFPPYLGSDCYSRV